MASHATFPGFPLPFGVIRQGSHCNFAVFATASNEVALCLFEPLATHPFLQQNMAHTGHVWHLAVEGLPSSFEYGYIVDGSPLLLDPYAKELASSLVWDNPGPYAAIPNNFYPCRSLYKDPTPFDWEGDQPLQLPIHELIIYEMHLRGFTQHASSGVSCPGTFSGMEEKIGHLKSLGINAVELMPIFEFNEREYRRLNPANGHPLCQYWGYSTVNFFTPMRRYGRQDPVVEFKSLVKKLHRQGIEVILDVVYNHTAEGGKGSPAFCFKGLSNESYYLLDSQGDYLNFSGCGNTIDAHNSIVIDFILNSLRYWVSEMHVDGFRFDLAAALTRGENGVPLSPAPLIRAITQDPLLAHTKLIAEPWDAVGLHLVGKFGGAKSCWVEWNDQYRDSVRRFLKGTPGEAGIFAHRICGSEDIYGHGRRPNNSVNFIVCHDGFTLADLVSYNHKHNLDNGEDNRDGVDNNHSWNCGEEGASTQQEVVSLRERQMRNHILALMISQGIPMILMGDEYGHTRQGNNNPWCQDNELNWFLWDKLEANNALFRFFRLAIHLRKGHPQLRKHKFLTPQDVDWHGVQPHQPNWDYDNRFIAFTLKDPIEHKDLYIAFNAHHYPTMIRLPSLQDKQHHWCVLADTSAPSPFDIFESDSEFPCLTKTHFKMVPHSALILKALS